MSERQTVNDLLERSRARIERLEPRAVQDAIEGGAILIDTRCAEQRQATGVVPGSVHVPLSVLFWRLDPASGFEDARLADPEARLILLCAHGYSSSLAAATLRDLGFTRSADVIGGFEAWQSAGLPVEPAGDRRP